MNTMSTLVVASVFYLYIKPNKIHLESYSVKQTVQFLSFVRHHFQTIKDVT